MSCVINVQPWLGCVRSKLKYFTGNERNFSPNYLHAHTYAIEMNELIKFLEKLSEQKMPISQMR